MNKNKGLKACPKCQTFTGPRSLKCKNESCDYQFFPGKKRKPKLVRSTGVGMGKKKCPECEKICGARSHFCPNCEYNFLPHKEKKTFQYVPIKRRLKKNEERVEDWENIENGRKIRVMKDSGDYYIGEDGERIYMSDPGVFTVRGRDRNGIKVYGNSGFGYVYMGPAGKSKSFSELYKAPCEIVVVN